MTKALDVARYIIETSPHTGTVQCQKLLYYVQAWSLAWDGVPMFDDRIEAWTMGPVVPAVWHSGGSRGAYALTSAQKAKIDAVVKHYSRWSGKELIDMTHGERPWRDARGDLPDDAPGDAEVTHDSMRCEFTLQSLAGQGPRRPHVDAEEADAADALALAAKAGRRWSRTLALLAE